MTCEPSFERDLTQELKRAALALGFDSVGVAAAGPTPGGARLREWLERGHAGSMHYIGRRLEERLDPRRLLEGARSVVAVALFYGPEAPEEPAPAPTEVGAAAPAPDGAPVVARYARGDDYHPVLLERLQALGAALEALHGQRVRWRAHVDTGPVNERAWAAQAGLGWIGRNTCLIEPRRGSYCLLGVLITDAQLEPDAPGVDHCGSCRACLDACPTDAFAQPYQLDATRCIAYTTIEDPGPIPPPLRALHGAHVFGCDICQEVCPWNQRRGMAALEDPLGLRERLAPRPPWRAPGGSGAGAPGEPPASAARDPDAEARATLRWLIDLDEAQFRAATRHSALRRARWRGLVRSALVAAGNAGSPADGPLREAIVRRARGADALLAEHARWALERLDARAVAGGTAAGDGVPDVAGTREGG